MTDAPSAARRSLEQALTERCRANADEYERAARRTRARTGEHPFPDLPDVLFQAATDIRDLLAALDAPRGETPAAQTSGTTPALRINGVNVLSGAKALGTIHYDHENETIRYVPVGEQPPPRPETGETLAADPTMGRWLQCPWCRHQWETPHKAISDWSACPSCHGSFSFNWPRLIAPPPASSAPATEEK